MSLSLDGYEEFRFFLTDSATEIQVFPQSQLIETLNVDKNLSRAIDGSIHSFKIANSINYEYSFPLSFVNSSDRFTINNLWSNQDEFIFQLRNATNNFNLDGRIINPTQPISQRTNQQNDLFSGIITFRSSTNNIIVQPTSIGPFILNDNIFGILNGELGVLVGGVTPFKWDNSSTGIWDSGNSFI